MPDEDEILDLQGAFFSNEYQAIDHGGQKVVGFVESKILAPTLLTVVIRGAPRGRMQGVSLTVNGASTQFSDQKRSRYTLWHREHDEEFNMEIAKLRGRDEHYVTFCNMWETNSGRVAELVGPAYMVPEVVSAGGFRWIRCTCSHGYGEEEPGSLVFDFKLTPELEVTFPQHLVDLVAASPCTG